MVWRQWLASGTVILGVLGTTAAIAQPVDPTTPPPIPRPVLLDLTTGPADPLLPSKLATRDYTPLERRAIRAAIEQLETAAEGAANLQQDDLAFELRFRSLRLRQVLGLAEELPALQQTGQQAREKNRSDEGQAIAKRLRQIEAANPALTPLQQRDLAIAYQEVRDFDNAIRLYRQLLATESTPNVRLELLDRLATSEFQSFRYGDAATSYGAIVELLTADPQLSIALIPQTEQPPARTRRTPVYSPRELALRQQIFSLEQIQRYTDAIALQETELSNVRLEQQPDWLLTLAANQQRAGDRAAAVATYQAAYRQALPLGQLAIARDALEALRNLYQAQQQTADAIAVYDLLFAQARQEGDLYSLMENYARLGSYQLQVGDRAAAEQALIEGQQVSSQLGYQGPELTALQTRLTVNPTPPAQ